ncbi:MAG: nuclear transport factor 2 family protein [Streptosporangiaceae bacterium]
MIDTQHDTDIDPDPDPDTGTDPDPDTGTSTELEEEEAAAEPRPGRDPLRIAAGALAGVAAVCALWSGWSWHAATEDASLRYSQLRDEVLRSGEQGVVNFTSLDYREVDKGLTTWLDSSTGSLNQEVAQGREAFTQSVLRARTVSTAKVLDGAVTELDDHAGKARIIVAVSLTVTPEGGRPVVKNNRLIAELTRTGSGWKLSALGQAKTEALGS